MHCNILFKNVYLSNYGKFSVRKKNNNPTTRKRQSLRHDIARPRVIEFEKYTNNNKNKKSESNL